MYFNVISVYTKKHRIAIGKKRFMNFFQNFLPDFGIYFAIKKKYSIILKESSKILHC